MCLTKWLMRAFQQVVLSLCICMHGLDHLHASPLGWSEGNKSVKSRVCVKRCGLGGTTPEYSASSGTACPRCSAAGVAYIMIVCVQQYSQACSALKHGTEPGVVPVATQWLQCRPVVMAGFAGLYGGVNWCSCPAQLRPCRHLCELGWRAAPCSQGTGEQRLQLQAAGSSRLHSSRQPCS